MRDLKAADLFVVRYCAMDRLPRSGRSAMLSKARVGLPFGMKAALLFLAIAVFIWGLQSKLALYKASSHDAPAKLCTRASDAAKSDCDHATDGGKLEQGTLLPALLSLTRLMPLHLLPSDAQDELARCLSPLRSTPILHLRPPPVEPNAQA